MESIKCFLPYISPEQITPVVEDLNKTGMIDKIYLMTSDPRAELYPGCEILPVDTLTSTQTIRSIYERADGKNVLLKPFSQTENIKQLITPSALPLWHWV